MGNRYLNNDELKNKNSEEVKKVTEITNDLNEDVQVLEPEEIPENIVTIGYSNSNIATSELGDIILDFTNKLDKTITGVTIPSFIKVIGKNAFNSSIYLNKIIFEGEILEIHDGAFSNCIQVEEFDFSLSNELNKIGEKAFSLCSNLKSIKIPNTITTIESSTFLGCKSLNEITLSTNITSIKSKAFKNCISLEKFIINDITEDNNEDVTEDIIKDNNENINENITEDANKNNIQETSETNNLTLPPNITTIENYIFSGCHNIKNVTLHENITKIGVGSFKNCSRLEKINIPYNVSTLSKNCFTGCINLNSLILHENILNIEKNVFEKVSNLKELTFNNNFTDTCKIFGNHIPISLSINVKKGYNVDFSIYNTFKVKITEFE